MEFKNFYEVVASLEPDIPVVCLHHHKSEQNIQKFLKHFPGKTFYAIKSNPEPNFIKYVMNQGVRHFDVASLNEVKLVHELATSLNIINDCTLAFMNPIKNRRAIREAYFEYGVRDFSFDTETELYKILDETKYAKDLGLHTRLVVPKGETVYDVSGRKFGADFESAVELLRLTSQYAERVGICFHVGSQITSNTAYSNAIAYVGKLLDESDVKLSVFDVGGGFPAEYPNSVLDDLTDYFAVIENSLASLNLCKTEIWCEPGRSIAAPSQSLIVKVNLRKGEKLYINDGVYGNLFESCNFTKQNYPSQLIRLNGDISDEIVPFELFGPTCDSVDYLPGPFYLPADAGEGDYIVFELAGAYTTCSSSNFNGFSDLICCEINA